MPLLTPSHVPRTVVSHLNPIPYDSGRALNGIYNAGDAYFGTQTVPPNNAWSDGTRSFMAPMSHFHLLQSETFHVTSGRGIWYLGDEVFELGEGEKITIPAWRAHRFENVPVGKESLTIEFRYDAQFFEMEESFFRNGLTYFDDCRKAGVAPSWLQMCVFCAKAWMVPDIIPVPGVRGMLGEYVRCLVNCAFMWVCAVVGWVVFGYRGSYREYYDPEGKRRKGW